MDRIKLIGISGKIQSGKDTTATILQNILFGRWEVKKFAFKLKLMVSALTNIPVTELEKEEVKNSSWNGMTVRYLLQKIGTEAMRGVISDTIWIDALFADWKPNPMFPGGWLITDVRFPNEAQAVIDHGGLLLRIERPSLVSSSTHPSETALDDYQNWSHVIVNDGTRDDLYRKIYDLNLISTAG